MRPPQLLTAGASDPLAGSEIRPATHSSVDVVVQDFIYNCYRRQEDLQCPPRVTGDRRQPSVSKPRQFRDAAAKQKESSDSHTCDSDETPPPYARTAV